MDQKLDTLVDWTKDHDTATSSMKQQLNLTFADIYERLGANYNKVQY